MNRISFLLALVLCLLGTALVAETKQEIFGSYTLLSQATDKHKGIQYQLGLVDPITEDFGLRYEYGYAKVRRETHDDFVKAGASLVARDEIKYSMHTFLVGAQKDLGHTLIGWGGLTAAVFRGSLVTTTGLEPERTFDFNALYIMSQAGFGQSWRIGESMSLGIDWLVLSVYFHRKVNLNGMSDLIALKGVYYESKYEIKALMDTATDIRTLGMRASLYF